MTKSGAESINQSRLLSRMGDRDEPNRRSNVRTDDSRSVRYSTSYLHYQQYPKGLLIVCTFTFKMHFFMELIYNATQRDHWMTLSIWMRISDACLFSCRDAHIHRKYGHRDACIPYIAKYGHQDVKIT